MMNSPQSITSQWQRLEPDAVIELFDLDMSLIGGPVVHYHGGTNQIFEPVVWQGVTYYPFPVQASGFEYSGQGQLPRPRLTVANTTGAISALVLTYGDLIGCKVTRRRTFQQYLDAVNFPNGNAGADPTAEFPQDIFYIEQRTSETRDAVEFQLSAAFDFQGLKLPRRYVIQNTCQWQYRIFQLSTDSFNYNNVECPYTGTQYFDSSDNPTTMQNDVCGKRLTSCQARFGVNNTLPYGAFPGCAVNT
jgi:lambda family phage minor tail protein L